MLIYLLIFTDTTSIKQKTKGQTRFVPAKVQISKPDFAFTLDEKKEKQTWFHQMKGTFSNLKLAFHDCKWTSQRYIKGHFLIMIFFSG